MPVDVPDAAPSPGAEPPGPAPGPQLGASSTALRGPPWVTSVAACHVNLCPFLTSNPFLVQHPDLTLARCPSTSSSAPGPQISCAVGAATHLKAETRARRCPAPSRRLGSRLRPQPPSAPRVFEPTGPRTTRHRFRHLLPRTRPPAESPDTIRYSDYLRPCESSFQAFVFLLLRPFSAADANPLLRPDDGRRAGSGVAFSHRQVGGHVG